MSTFNSPTDVEPITRAMSSKINALDAAIVAAFALLPSETRLKYGTVWYAVDAGAVNAYVVTLPETPTALTDGMIVVVKPLNTNTGASTINVNALGVTAIRRTTDAALEAGDIQINTPIMMIYSSTTGHFHVPPSSTLVATATAATATPAMNALFAALGASAKYALEDHAHQTEMRHISEPTDDTVTAADLLGDVRFDNTGAGGAVNLTLPAATAGARFNGCVTVAQYLKFTANGTDTFRYWNQQGAAGGYIRSNVIGTKWACECFVAGEWIISNLVGILQYDE